MKKFNLKDVLIAFIFVVLLGLVLSFMTISIAFCHEIQHTHYQEPKEIVSDIKADVEPEQVKEDTSEYDKAMAKIFAQADIKTLYPNTLTKSGGTYPYNGKVESWYGPSAAYDYQCKLDYKDVWRTQRSVSYNKETKEYYLDTQNGTPTWLFVIASQHFDKQTIHETSFGLAIVLDWCGTPGRTDVFVGPKWYEK